MIPVATATPLAVTLCTMGALAIFFLSIQVFSRSMRVCVAGYRVLRLKGALQMPGGFLPMPSRFDGVAHGFHVTFFQFWSMFVSQMKLH